MFEMCLNMLSTRGQNLVAQTSTVFPSEPLEGNFVRVWTVWIKSRLGTARVGWLVAKVATLRYEIL